MLGIVAGSDLVRRKRIPTWTHLYLSGLHRFSFRLGKFMLKDSYGARQVLQGVATVGTKGSAQFRLSDDGAKGFGHDQTGEGPAVSIQ